MSDVKPTDRVSNKERPPSDPRSSSLDAAEIEDPHSGVSDDPRVDPTPDRRHTKG